jgi:hypothetical protein
VQEVLWWTSAKGGEGIDEKEDCFNLIILDCVRNF